MGKPIEKRFLWNIQTYEYDSLQNIIKITQHNLERKIDRSWTYVYFNGLLSAQEEQNTHGFIQTRLTYEYEKYR